ncbi:unnamed protein product [Chilo suppressalis]|uniref:RNA-binding protein MEX3B n=1 Tax=Chilo suppressalis TaxID=168631 RepID=A0ABN8B1P1_CHISP|nr:unnamed protein product [Chilo suppressalis]
MPTSLFGELGGGGGLVEDQRALQLALELSMLNFGDSLPSANPLASPLGFAPPPDDRAKKSQNMTECVPVPSSEHVAEIVGRQGIVKPEQKNAAVPTCNLVELPAARRPGELNAAKLRPVAAIRWHRIACVVMLTIREMKEKTESSHTCERNVLRSQHWLGSGYRRDSRRAFRSTPPSQGQGFASCTSLRA